jgi:hypothetical protein
MKLSEAKLGDKVSVLYTLHHEGYHGKTIVGTVIGCNRTDGRKRITLGFTADQKLDFPVFDNADELTKYHDIISMSHSTFGKRLNICNSLECEVLNESKKEPTMKLKNAKVGERVKVFIGHHTNGDAYLSNTKTSCPIEATLVGRGWEKNSDVVILAWKDGEPTGGVHHQDGKYWRWTGYNEAAKLNRSDFAHRLGGIHGDEVECELVSSPHDTSTPEAKSSILSLLGVGFAAALVGSALKKSVAKPARVEEPAEEEIDEEGLDERSNEV